MINKLLTASLAILIGVAFGMAINNVTAKSASQEVYAVCQQSRMSATISEKHCGELQDKYNIEFLCKANNTLATNYCWTEIK